MTLLISVDCKNGFLIITDRKEELDGINNIEKYLLSKSKDFFIALSGNVNLSKGILSSMNTKEINVENIKDEIEKFIKNLDPITDIRTNSNKIENNESYSNEIEGFLVLKNNKQFELKNLEISKQGKIFLSKSPPIFFIGSKLGKNFAKCFLENIRFQDMTCDDVAKYVITAMEKLSKYDSAVGGLGYGIDVTMFSTDGEIIQRNRVTDTNTCSMDINFRLLSKHGFFNSITTVTGGSKNGA